MNKPPYIFVDVMGAVVARVKAKLGLVTLNYQYGYIRELNETLESWSKTPEDSVNKYPLIWVAQPFLIAHESFAWWGELQNGMIFIIQQSNSRRKAAERMAEVFKAVINPIYYELLNQIARDPAFDVKGVDPAQIKHTEMDRYYWGEKQQTMINDVIDCKEISNLFLKINNNKNCGVNLNG